MTSMRKEGTGSLQARKGRSAFLKQEAQRPSADLFILKEELCWTSSA
jgi:hypothetical protein